VALPILRSFGEPSLPPNTLTIGDCRSVLAQLDVQPSTAGHVRLAYLDPPFNTGERSRGYLDTYTPEGWRSFMAERLELSWQLLREDGSLWVHCDDAEQGTLRVLMDELFGRRSFVSTIVWQRRYSRENRRSFSPTQDYLHVYAPAGAGWKHHRNRLSRQDDDSTWRNHDDDPRGPWSTVSLVAQGGHGTKSQWFAITLPSGRVVEPPAGSCWRVTAERFEQLRREELIWFGAKGDNVPRRKVFLADAKGLVPSTWWPHTEVGHNAEANGEQRRLHGAVAPFSTPKPERLMARILEIATNPGDLVLDPFVGSGTTAAVAHKLDRRWHGIELDEVTVKGCAEPRLRSVVAGTDPNGITVSAAWAGGGGFVVAWCDRDAPLTLDYESVSA
jgi:adenine-specific DNA-methyltransferase